MDSLNLGGNDGWLGKHHRRHLSSGSMKHIYDSIEVVPTSAAEASRWVLSMNDYMVAPQGEYVGMLMTGNNVNGISNVVWL